jgi:hypothetical protein
VDDGVGAGGERPYLADKRCAALNARMGAGSEFRAGEPIRQRRSAEIALLRLGDMRANGVQSLLVSGAFQPLQCPAQEKPRKVWRGAAAPARGGSHLRHLDDA